LGWMVSSKAAYRGCETEFLAAHTTINPFYSDQLCEPNFESQIIAVDLAVPRKKMKFLDLNNDILLTLFDHFTPLPGQTEHKTYPPKSFPMTSRRMCILSRPLLLNSITLGRKQQLWTGNEWREARADMEGLLTRRVVEGVKKLRVELG